MMHTSWHYTGVCGVCQAESKHSHGVSKQAASTKWIKHLPITVPDWHATFSHMHEGMYQLNLLVAGQNPSVPKQT